VYGEAYNTAVTDMAVRWKRLMTIMSSSYD